jgi:hypothetical protein
VMDPIEISDIDAIDSVFVRMLNKLRSPDVPASVRVPLSCCLSCLPLRFLIIVVT